MNLLLWAELGVVSGSAFFWGVVIGALIMARTRKLEWRTMKDMPEKA